MGNIPKTWNNISIYSNYEPRRDPTPFTRTCASRMAHRLRQTSKIFRQVEILLAHRRSKWTNSEAGNYKKKKKYIYIYYAFNARLLTKSWQPYACLNSQNYHPPHGTPSFMASPTYKLGCDRRYIPMILMIISTSCQSTLSSTSPWHTADQIDFIFQVIFWCFWFLPRSSQPFHKSLGSLPKTAPCPEAAAQATTAAAADQAADQAADHCKAFPKPLRAGLWLAAFRRGPNEVRTRSEIKFWEADPLSLLTDSLVATRFRILFRTVKLKSFQRWSRRGNQAKQQLQARARRQKRRQRASKGDRGETSKETEGRQRDTSLANKEAVTNLSGHRLFET